MRKITQNAINAFLSGKNYFEGNTGVKWIGCWFLVNGVRDTL